MKKPKQQTIGAEETIPSVLNLQPSAAAACHDEIAARAYELYLQEGCPQGRAEVHWLAAEAQLRGGSQSGQEPAAPASTTGQEAKSGPAAASRKRKRKPKRV
jgi:hypothetical protein